MTTARTLIDLSMPISPTMPTNRPDHVAPRLDSYSTIEENGWDGTMITIDSHCGTHLDAPSHFVPNGATVERLSLSVLIGPAQVVDARIATVGRRITLRGFPPITSRRVILHTGWSERANDGTDDYFRNHTFIDPPLARHLVDSGVVLVGIDGPSVDADGAEAHHILLGGGVLIVENLAATALLPPQIELIVMPLRLVGLDGSPVRAVAMVDRSS
ncbi:cyclase [Mycolicibacterium madagascariense]|uniref:Cyclase n=1 Tax=Mycolicibacterium madagascariense TaxID=212765 RepID=A0A7I7XMZ9_9MYCO|nr:cyclase family protein [Mycolicibacterium madagascariense]MCV7010877.1 cyclase family protein [Mycolicibacterium madagascariense]BBZ30574.1 cyclase [Mycolicibacterium madagascariense]